jgi:Ni/Co efflux regulator RcnB
MPPAPPWSRAALTGRAEILTAMKRRLLIMAGLAGVLTSVLTPLSAAAQERERPQRGERPGGPGRERGSGPGRTQDRPQGRPQGGWGENRRPDRGGQERPRHQHDRPGGGSSQRPDPRPDSRPDSRPGPRPGQDNRPGFQRPDRNDGPRPQRPDNRHDHQHGRPDWRNDDRRPSRPDRPNSPSRPSQPHRPQPSRPSQGRDRHYREFHNQWNRDRWRRNWVQQRRTDWWRNDRAFRGWNGVRSGFYFAPGFGYYSVPRNYWGRRFRIGEFLPSIFWRYQADYRTYGLGYPPPGTQWVHVDNSLYLIDSYDGYIIEALYDAWRW